MRPLLIIILVVISAGIIQTGWLPLLFLTGGGIFYLVSTDKSGGESVFPWLALIALIGGIASLILG